MFLPKHTVSRRDATQPSKDNRAADTISSFLNSVGSVHHTDPGNALPGLGGYANSAGNHVTNDLAKPSGSILNANSNDISFASHFNGFLIPGLGAPFKTIGLENNKKVVVSPPVNVRSIPIGPHSRKGGACDSDRPQQKGLHSIDIPAAHEQQQTKTLDTTTGHSGEHQLSSPKQDSLVLAHASPEGPAATPNKSDAPASTSDAVKAPEYVRPTGPPPVWTEKQTPRTFKLQHQTSRRRHETFEGAYQILSSLNPDHYLMPYGVSSNHTTRTTTLLTPL